MRLLRGVLAMLAESVSGLMALPWFDDGCCQVVLAESVSGLVLSAVPLLPCFVAPAVVPA